MQHPEVLVVLAGWALFFGLHVLGTNKAKRLIETWARSNGCSVVSMRRRYPIFTASKTQRVFRVEVVVGDGQTRQADVTCGHWLIGMSSPKIKVDWRS
jgi:hypothetical protein